MNAYDGPAVVDQDWRDLTRDLVNDGATAQDLVDLGAAPDLYAAGQRIRRIREGRW